jgi:hypothetical protein
MALSQTAKGPGELLEWRQRNLPAIEGSTGSTSPGKMGKIKVHRLWIGSLLFRICTSIHVPHLLQFGADAGRELAVLYTLEADPIVA